MKRAEIDQRLASTLGPGPSEPKGCLDGPFSFGSLPELRRTCAPTLRGLGTHIPADYGGS